MAEASRPLLVVVVLSAMLVAIWLLVPQPSPPKPAQTPLAPVGAIEKARDATSVSDAANARMQAESAAASEQTR